MRRGAVRSRNTQTEPKRNPQQQLGGRTYPLQFQTLLAASPKPRASSYATCGRSPSARSVGGRGVCSCREAWTPFATRRRLRAARSGMHCTCSRNTHTECASAQPVHLCEANRAGMRGVGAMAPINRRDMKRQSARHALKRTRRAAHGKMGRRAARSSESRRRPRQAATCCLSG